MDRRTFTSLLITAANSGTLLTRKHDPNGGTLAYYRSVLTPTLSGNLDTFIASSEYDIDWYTDRDYPNGAGTFVMKARPASGVSVVGLGVPSGSTPAASMEPHDALLAVSGAQQGWHLFSTSSAGVASMVASGRLTLSGSF